MNTQPHIGHSLPREQRACPACRSEVGLGIGLGMAFQPIIDAAQGGRVIAQEALVRGMDGQGAGWVLGQVAPEALYAFDQACRVTAIEEASRLGLAATGAKLSINFLPNAVYNPLACIQATLRAAERTGFPRDQLMFEVSEGEKVRDPGHLQRIFHAYRAMGFTVAIDDFGAGYAGLSLLADLEVDVVKLDMALVRGCDASRPRRVILASVLAACRELGVQVIAEGVETDAECTALREIGITLFQGYLFAKPGFRSLPAAHQPAGFSPAAAPAPG